MSELFFRAWGKSWGSVKAHLAAKAVGFIPVQFGHLRWSVCLVLAQVLF